MSDRVCCNISHHNYDIGGRCCSINMLSISYELHDSLCGKAVITNQSLYCNILYHMILANEFHTVSRCTLILDWSG